MATSMYAQAISRRRARMGSRRWSRDLRAPALRLTQNTGTAFDLTASLPLISPHTTQVPELHEGPRPVITLREIQPRETMPFMGRVTACPYLEYRSANRRCLSADPAPISLERQVRHCFSESHRQCRYYRKARGLPSVPPNQAAFYTAAAVLLLVFVAVANL